MRFLCAKDTVLVNKQIKARPLITIFDHWDFLIPCIGGFLHRRTFMTWEKISLWDLTWKKCFKRTQMKKCQNLQGVLFCNIRTRENMLDILWQNIWTKSAATGQSSSYQQLFVWCSLWGLIVWTNLLIVRLSINMWLQVHWGGAGRTPLNSDNCNCHVIVI